MEKKKQSTSSCETCIHHAYDETYLAYYCDLLLDEDELERYSYTERSCPFTSSTMSTSTFESRSEQKKNR